MNTSPLIIQTANAENTLTAQYPDRFDTDISRGLTAEQVAENLLKYGYNELRQHHGASTLTILIRQFQSTVVALLLVAAAVSLLTREFVQAGAIFVAVLINAVVGFITELKAKVSLEALENLAGPTSRVIRDGKQQELPARELVPGDVVLLDSGARVPADTLLLEAASLSLEESMLSGESVPVFKEQVSDTNQEKESQLAFQGTLVLTGRATALVTATGNNTKLGSLGELLEQTISTRTPLEQQLEKLGQQLTWLTVGLCVALFLIGLLHHANLWLMLQTSIALAVAAIPEGLPVVSTLALAEGTRRMIKAGALIRQLAAVETLGCTTVICSDKTGTLTENQMLVTDLILQKRHLTVSGEGYEPIGELSENGAPLCSVDDKLLVDLLRVAALCNDAKIENHDGELQWHVHGDPTEGALLTAAGKIDLDHKQLLLQHPRVFEIPFDLNRKRMTTVHKKDEDHIFSCTKGSPETILTLCSRVAAAQGAIVLSESNKTWFLEQNDALAQRGLRVLAVATRSLPADDSQLSAEKIEKDLILLGLIGMADQPRAHVEVAIKSCQDAGIRVIMVTGDQPSTAAAIARKLNILDKAESSSNNLSGAELSSMSDKELQQALIGAQVLARVNPEMKLKVVQSLQQMGEIVAMTGDGVNDAPALRQANIGVSMGRSGTALAREASNMVITDDNFASIAKAVEQGRIIYGNIRQAIAYLLTASMASVLSVFALVMIGESSAFSPLQLLWLNLIMHIFPGIALVLQPASTDVMSRPPRGPKEPLLTRSVQLQIFVRSIIVTLAVIASMYLAGSLTLPGVQTMAFATLSLSLIFQALSWALVQHSKNGIQFRLLCNKTMVTNICTSLFLLAISIYLPPLQAILESSALSASELAVVCACSLISFTVTLMPWPRLSSRPSGTINQSV